jgi:phenylacetate-coenzyme A ligase PaaK-like adenylate-forming protein
MSTAEDTIRRRSFASASRYAPLYPHRCRQAVDEAMDSAPAYQAWRQHDRGPRSAVFRRLADLSSLTKRDLRAHGPQGFVPHGRSIEEGLAAGQIELVATSGTTGDRVTNVWYQPWWNGSEAASWRLNSHAASAATGDHREAILTSPWCAGLPCEDGLLTMDQRMAGRFLYLTERSDPSAWPDGLMDRMVRELNKFRPVVLEANPSFLARLSRYIVKNRLAVTSPALIILTYEAPSVLHRRQIGLAFESPVASSYGTTEAGYVFMECEAGRMHQVAESCHVDFLPFAAGHGGPQIGKILVTTFNNPWRSLVRFDAGDVVHLDGQMPCPCGRSEGLILASIEGRTVNLTCTPDGRVVTRGQVDRALGQVQGLAEYQLVQLSNTIHDIRFVVDQGDAGQVAREIRAALRAVYSSDAAIRTEEVSAIAPDPPGKYQTVKSMEPVDANMFLDAQFAPRASPVEESL